jgi:hypothetical protein
MSTQNSVQLIISAKGLVRAICTDQTLSVLKHISNDQVDVKRASHVEWSTGISAAANSWLLSNRDDCTAAIPAGWWADLLPSGGPVLGPFNTHADAIAAELAWLHDNHIPTGEKSER